MLIGKEGTSTVCEYMPITGVCLGSAMLVYRIRMMIIRFLMSIG